MKQKERLRGLMRAPRLAWDALVRGRYDFTYDQIVVPVREMSMSKRFNLVRAGANLVHRRLIPWSWPLHMQVELTSYCNLQCPVCPTGTGELVRPPMAMDVELFKRFMREVGPYLLTLSLWGWGEPLLHPRLDEILRIAKDYPLVSLLSTNGQNLIDQAVMDALLSSPPAHLIVAIDGLSDETNARYRVGAKLDRILAGVHNLARLRDKKNISLPALHMRYIVMKHNQHELPHVRDFAERNGFDFLSIRALSIIHADERKHRELVPDIAEFKAYQYEGDTRIHRRDFICQQPFWFPTVLADGVVAACCEDWNGQMTLGLLSDTVSFADLWFSKRAAGIRKIIRDDPESLSFCRSCPYADHQSDACSVQGFAVQKGER